MVKSDTVNRYNGLIQRCEDNCGLGETGITSNSDLYSKFIGWLNEGNRMGANYAIMSWNGVDFDDVGYTTAPHGTFAGTTDRDYNFDESYKAWKIKLVQPTYDGTNFYAAKAFDAEDRSNLATNDPNVDLQFSIFRPRYDERAYGFDLYPKFTSEQVAAGAAVYVEWFRGPRDWDTTTATDEYEPCLDPQFHHFPAVYASWQYSKLYKPDIAAEFQGDIFGARTARGQLIRQGLLQDMEDWYNAKGMNNTKVTIKRRPRV